MASFTWGVILRSSQTFFLSLSFNLDTITEQCLKLLPCNLLNLVLTDIKVDRSLPKLLSILLKCILQWKYLKYQLQNIFEIQNLYLYFKYVLHTLRVIRIISSPGCMFV